MAKITISSMEIGKIDFLADQIQALSKLMMVVDLDEFDNQGCGGLLHHDIFIVCNRSAEKIREKLKNIENGNAT